MAIDQLKEWFIRSRQTAHQSRLPSEGLERIGMMFAALEADEPLARPSRYWEELNRMNLAQMEEHGYENFRQTIALNYFTWVRIMPWDSQFRFLCKHLPLSAILRAIRGSLTPARQGTFSALNAFQSFTYRLISLLLWEYLLRLPLPEPLAALREPSEGNPPLVHPRPGLAVSQDLGNSLLEYDSFQASIPAEGPATIVELGGGYGRNAYVVLSLRSETKYVCVDVPPALWIAEKYLPAVFPEKRIFRYRPFARFEEAAGEYAEAQIVFLLSSQLAKIPSQSADLVLNISSLHEMRKDQINYYLGQFDRVLKPGGHAYLKQWKTARVLFEGITISREDYPIPAGWSVVMDRTARVQTEFFEALYRKSSR